MINLKLSSVNAHPAEIFKALEDRRAEIEWSNRKEEVTLPKYTPTEAPKLNAGVWNMAMNLLNELKP